MNFQSIELSGGVEASQVQRANPNKEMNLPQMSQPEDPLKALEWRVTKLEKLLAEGKPKPDPKKDRNTPSVPEALTIARIFRRKPTTKWTAKEVFAFKAQHPFLMEDLELIERYYAFERAKDDKGIHRRDLATFLNNYPGELDRAQEWARRFPKLASRPLGKGAAAATSAEPAGFRAWMAARYPSADQKMPWGKVPNGVKDEFSKL